jgi:alpha-ketoglutarate-dependent taurine dioxygenase
MSTPARRYLLCLNSRLPLAIEATTSMLLSEYLNQNRNALDSDLLEHGAVVFRNFQVTSAADFDDVVAQISANRLRYTYRSTPRTSVGRDIFTATEYPASEEIPLHNENSYQLEWPGRIAFCCLQPPLSGGETPLADMRKVSKAIGASLVEKFASLKVRYVRVYRNSIDLPWQTVFQTTSRQELQLFCQQNSIEYEWLPGDVLRTAQVAQGAATHPRTSETLFFNQAHLFHLSRLGEANAKAMMRVFGEALVPRNAVFGDGTAILSEELQQVRRGFEEHAVMFPWRAGDVAVVDNMLVAHGRRPYSGPRKLLAALLDPLSEKCIADPLQVKAH